MCHYRSKVPNVLIAITVFHVNLCYISTSRRDAAQWLERDSFPIVTPGLVQNIQRNVMFLPSQCLDICFDVVYVGKARYPHILHLSHL